MYRETIQKLQLPWLDSNLLWKYENAKILGLNWYKWTNEYKWLFCASGIDFGH